ncbi:class I SAM-dependent methyltransferase [Candidatus Dependentiae bacterium]|nr:class I SAM-dependent methyltransferase [Candidatus Dependentiae bacterium]
MKIKLTIRKLFFFTLSIFIFNNKRVFCDKTSTTQQDILTSIAHNLSNQPSLQKTLIAIFNNINQINTNLSKIASIVTNSNIFASFNNLETSFQHALYPESIEHPITAIGHFIWDFNKSSIFANQTKIVSELLEQILCIYHKTTTTTTNFSNAKTLQDFVIAHEALTDQQTINTIKKKLKNLIQLIQTESLCNLTNASYLEETLLLQLGLNNENILEFPISLNAYFGAGLKSWQYPIQFSKLLVFLSKLNISTYLEIGCRHGGTFIIISEYLKRFNSTVKSYAIDPFYSLPMSVYTSKINHDAFYIIDFSTSKRFIDLSNLYWNICFIDGDHSLVGVTNDYNLVRNNSDVIVFHDTVNAVCQGVVAFWNNLKKTTNALQIIEFIDQYQEVMSRTGNHYLGIGIFYKNNILK